MDQQFSDGSRLIQDERSASSGQKGIAAGSLIF